MMRLVHALAEALVAHASAGQGPILIPGDVVDAGDPAIEAGHVVPAAVLVPIVTRPRPTVILTRRNAMLKTHAGQIAFPGGRIDPGDRDPAAAALREAQEEIGLDPALVRVLGHADPYRTISGYHITPVVGLIDPDPPLSANEAEVAAIFEAPLDHLLEPANHVEQSVEWQGRDRHYFEIMWQEERIWGATAGMIVNLGRLIAYGR